MDHIKSAKKKVMVTMPDGSDVFAFLNLNAKETDSDIIKTQFTNRMHMLLSKIPQEQREIIIMRFFYKMSLIIQYPLQHQATMLDSFPYWKIHHRDINFAS